MQFVYFLHTTFAGIFPFSSLTDWWPRLLAFAVVMAVAVLFHFLRISRIENQKADMQRQLVEKTELLQYAKDNEEKAIEKIVQAEKSKISLLTKINQEIRTPMNGVLGMANLLNETELSPEQREYSETILTAGNSLLNVVNEIIINDIVEYSKVDSGKELDLKEFDLSSCIEEVFDVFANKASVLNVNLLYHVEQTIPDCVVGDISRVRQILMNCIENSLEFTTNGTVLVKVKLLQSKDSHNLKLQFEVNDNGTGMDEQMRTVLNNHFRQSGHHNKIKGSGLVICHKLVKLMGGEIALEGEEGKGCSVLFSINLKAGTTQQKQLYAGHRVLEGKRALLVTGNQTVADIMNLQLEQLKMVVTIQPTDAAIETFAKDVADIIIIDSTENDNSILLAQSLKEINAAPAVILLKQPSDNRYKTIERLFEAVINKPLKKQVLTESILAPFRHHMQATIAHEQPVRKLSTDFAAKYPLNILIAEDNMLNQQWVNKILHKLGYTPDTVSNGREALEAVGNRQYDLILMDVQMPEMDGKDAARMIRLCLQQQPVIIAMTANTMQGDKQDCLQAGMNDYISKPVDMSHLMDMLEKWGYLLTQKVA
jgi:signal transduction histidine kinase/CheY-like chemotaxis protein